MKILKGAVTLAVVIFVLSYLLDNFGVMKKQTKDYFEKPVSESEKVSDFTDTEEYKEMSEAEQCEYWKEFIRKKSVVTYDDKVRRDRACK